MKPGRSGTFPIATRSKKGSQRSDRAILIATDRTFHSRFFFELDREEPQKRDLIANARIAAICTAIYFFLSFFSFQMPDSIESRSQMFIAI